MQIISETVDPETSVLEGGCVVGCCNMYSGRSSASTYCFENLKAHLNDCIKSQNINEYCKSLFAISENHLLSGKQEILFQALTENI